MNDLQRLIRLRGLNMFSIGAALELDPHSVQKVVKGTRKTPHVQEGIAAYIGVPVEHLFGPGARQHITRLINNEIDRRKRLYEIKLKRQFIPPVRNRLAG